MAAVLIGTEADFDHDTRLYVELDGREVGVLRHEGEYYAFENRCPHQGGPVCDGMVIGRVETLLSAEKEHIGQRFSDAIVHLVCPWHGWEYDLRTGACAADRRFHLRRYRAECRQGSVYLSEEAEPLARSGGAPDD